MSYTRGSDTLGSFVITFKNISYDVGRKKFLFQGKDIYEQSYKPEILKELSQFNKKIQKIILSDETALTMERKAEPEFLEKRKVIKNPTASVDKLIATLEQYSKVKPFVVLGERAIYESAKKVGQTEQFKEEITTLSIYQKDHNIDDFLSVLKCINKFAAIAHDFEHIKIYRLGKLKIEVLLEDDSYTQGVMLTDHSDISTLIKYLRHSGFLSRKILNSNKDEFFIDDDVTYEYANSASHLVYRLALMLSRKKVLDKERKLVNIITEEAYEDPLIQVEAAALITKHNLEKTISVSLNTLNNEKSLKLKELIMNNI